MARRRLDGLSREFEPDVVEAITAAYASVLAADNVAYESRLSIVQALIEEAEAGYTEPAHLLEVARIFASPTRDRERP